MSLIITLPVLEGAKIIVVDEESEVEYAGSLITGWLPIWKSKDARSVELLLFSGPKQSNKIYLNCLDKHEINVHDFYTLSADKIDPLADKKLWDIVDINFLNTNSTVIIDSLSSLLLYKGLAETCQFIDKLSAKVSQIVCIYQRDFTPKKIPSVKTLGTSYVRLESMKSLKLEHNFTYKALISHCKPGGGILQQIEIVKQNINSYDIKTERENIKIGQKSDAVKPESTEKIQASFRIEMNDREMKQREATPLPYTSGFNESKIHYEPDEIDDLDEEDPDDDLDF